MESSMSGKWVITVLAWLIYGFLLAPTLVVVIASFNAGAFLTFPPQGLSFRWYNTFFHNRVFLDAIETSLYVALIATGVSGIISTMAALYAARSTPSVSGAVRLALTLPLILPEVLSAIGLLFFFYATGLGVRYSIALVFGHVLITLPFIYINVSNALRGFDWSWEMAARSLGASPVRAFRRVTFPLILPGIMNGCLFAFIASFDSFSTSFLLKDIGTATLPIQLFDYLRLNFTPEAAAVSTVTVAVTTFLVFVMEKFILPTSLDEKEK
ncbi:polyamine transporter PotC [Acetobacter senegalensis]|uniref:Polyamine transporter PotC n=2 Tax=Acetobacter senegalensis TaxID=446692 RepID=A0A0U5EVY5_9PROT|nr:polyamine transporter PotC [Acetobacter senegalensis]